MTKKTIHTRTIILIAVAVLAIMIYSFINVKNPLENTEWKLSGWSISSIKADTYPMILLFDDKSNLGGNSSTNGFSAPYKIKWGNRITIDSIMSSGIASNDPKRNKAESNYFNLLKKVYYYKKEDTTLTFLDKNKQEILIYTKQNKKETKN